MRVVLSDGRTIHVVWRYELGSDELYQGPTMARTRGSITNAELHKVKSVMGKNLIRTTLCFISEAGQDSRKDNPFLGRTGYAVCSRQDQFCKETGRKISLTRALVGGDFKGIPGYYNKEDRALIWQAYGLYTHKAWADPANRHMTRKQYEKFLKDNGIRPPVDIVTIPATAGPMSLEMKSILLSGTDTE